MELSNVNLRPICESATKKQWRRDVFLSKAAEAQVQEIARTYGMELWMAHDMLACHLLGFLTAFANNEWFARHADHWFTGFKFGEPGDTPEGMCEHEYGFVMRRDGSGEKMYLTIVTESEGYLSQDYHIGQAVEIGKMMLRSMEEGA